MYSVVIPAHNESAVIEDCLTRILDGAEAGELEVIVVVNGCSDDTADRARRFGSPVKVIETDVPSKNNALNLGDQAATGFPRFFVDADIVLPLQSIRTVASQMEARGLLAAAPRLCVELGGASWFVRRYHDIWLRLRYVQDGMLGSGVYAVSEAGRSRFDRFPDIIADDCMVRLAFEAHEKASISDAWFELTPPKTLRSLIHINVRRRVGVDEMSKFYPAPLRAERIGQRKGLLALAVLPGHWLSFAVYAYAKFAVEVLFQWKKLQGRQTEWNRDETTR